MAASIKSEPKSEPFESVSYGEGRTDPELGQCEPRHSDPVSLEDSIMALCVTSQEGVTDEMIVREYPNIDSGKRLKALQRLLSTVPPPPAFVCMLHVASEYEWRCARACGGREVVN